MGLRSFWFDICGIFILPPKREELIRRIMDRGEIDSDDLRNRLKNTRKEMLVAGEFKYCLINEDLDVAYSIFRFIIEKEMGF